LRQLKNKLILVRAETIRLNKEIQKLRDELHDLHSTYHDEWRELQRLDKEFYDKSCMSHRDSLLKARKELSGLIEHITRIMRAVPY